MNSNAAYKHTDAMRHRHSASACANAINVFDNFHQNNSGRYVVATSGLRVYRPSDGGYLETAGKTCRPRNAKDFARNGDRVDLP